MDEQSLFEKLRKIEALYVGASTAGERGAARAARERILERIRVLQEETPVEYQFSMPDMWRRRVFLALLRRYGIRPYRYKRQRYTTVMVRAAPKIVDDIIWPQYLSFSETLASYLSEVTDRVVADVLHADASEAEVVVQQPELPFIPTTNMSSTPADGGQGSATSPAETNGSSSSGAGKPAREQPEGSGTERASAAKSAPTKRGRSAKRGRGKRGKKKKRRKR